MKRILPWAFRVFFGLLLVTTAIGKLLDNRGFAEVIATYQLHIPDPLLLPLGLTVSLAELGIGVAIFAGRSLPTLAGLSILIHLGYASLATLTNLRGLELTNCGCFGVFLARPMTWGSVVEDVVLTLLAVGFWWSVGVQPALALRKEAEDAPALEATG